METKEFIKRLKKAKKLIVELYPDVGCIYTAASKAGLIWAKNCEFGRNMKEPGMLNYSSYWMAKYEPTLDQVLAVFDESIRLAEETK